MALGQKVGEFLQGYTFALGKSTFLWEIFISM
jgi:hypothetical protein